MNPGKETPPQILPENFNNFYEYLPGGMHRSDGKYWSEEKQKVIDDLDKIAKDLNIDIDSISREAHLGEDLMDKATKHFKDNFGKPEEAQKLKEAQKLGDEADKIRRSAHEKMIPLFKALLELGYSQDILIR